MWTWSRKLSTVMEHTRSRSPCVWTVIRTRVLVLTLERTEFVSLVAHLRVSYSWKTSSVKFDLCLWWEVGEIRCLSSSLFGGQFLLRKWQISCLSSLQRPFTLSFLYLFLYLFFCFFVIITHLRYFFSRRPEAHPGSSKREPWWRDTNSWRAVHSSFQYRVSLQPVVRATLVHIWNRRRFICNIHI